MQAVGDVVYHSRPAHVVYFAAASLKRVVVQNRQSLSCNLQGLNYTKWVNENACPSFPVAPKVIL